MPEISSVKSLKHKCVDFIVNNIDSFPKESLSIELEPVHPKKVPFYFKDLRILPNKFSYKISVFISLKFFFCYSIISFGRTSQGSQKKWQKNLSAILTSSISCKLQYQEYKAMGRGGGQVVSVLAFNSDDLSSNPVEAYSFFCKISV